jgi:hypothetical protein
LRAGIRALDGAYFPITLDFSAKTEVTRSPLHTSLQRHFHGLSGRAGSGLAIVSDALASSNGFSGGFSGDFAGAGLTGIKRGVLFIERWFCGQKLQCTAEGGVLGNGRATNASQ